MVKKVLSVIIALLLLLIPYTAFADDSDTHTHDFSGNAVSFGLTVDGLSVQVTETACINTDCTYVKYDADFLVFHFSYVSDKHLSADEVYKQFMAWRLNQIGANSGLEKIDTTNGGANIPAAGGRNPKGYEDEGKPNVTSSGASCIWVEPFGISSSSYGFRKSAPSDCVTGSSQSGTSWSFQSLHICPQYYFTAPVTGLYFVGSYGSPYDFGTFSYFETRWKLKYLTANFTQPYQYSISLTKGETCYFGFDFIDSAYCPINRSYKFSLNKIPIYIEPLGDSSITTTNNITINNNTWNGNIYTDNSTNLTYIYPQYTTVNEKNETVTNISNTPIIYNNETKQYYTYDQTTKNYYYITYNAPSPSPTPAPTDPPSPSPSPSPAPVEPILPETQNLIIPKMDSNTFTDEHGTWVASGSSKYSDVFDFFHAFDRSTSDFWETNASPSYLQIEIPDPENYYIDGYIMRISKFTNRYAKEWTLQGSDDGNTWYDLDKQTGQNLSDLEEHKYPLTLRKACKYYRLNMSSYASSMCSLSHFNLLGYDAKDVVMPTPSPAPEPGGGSGSGGSSGGSGSSWWEKLLDKLGSALIDGLLGAISAVLKLIFKLLSTILGWIIWLVSQVLTLFPFLPPGLGALLIGGVVVCFVIGIIKFIRG